MKMIEDKKNYLTDCDCECKEPVKKHCYEDYDYDYECEKPIKKHCYDDCDHDYKCRKPVKKHYYEDDDYKCKKPTKKHCYEEYCMVKKPCSCAPEPGKSLLKCARGSAGPLPAIAAGTLLQVTFPVGSITIDTRELCNPTILLKYNMIISTVVALTTSLTFTVFKCCNGCKQPVGESVTFAVTPAILASQAFSFQVCDCSNCCDCVTYSVEITSATTIATGVTVLAQMSALAVENIC